MPRPWHVRHLHPRDLGRDQRVAVDIGVEGDLLRFRPCRRQHVGRLSRGRCVPQEQQRTCQQRGRRNAPPGYLHRLNPPCSQATTGTRPPAARDDARKTSFAATGPRQSRFRYSTGYATARPPIPGANKSRGPGGTLFAVRRVLSHRRRGRGAHARCPSPGRGSAPGFACSLLSVAAGGPLPVLERLHGRAVVFAEGAKGRVAQHPQLDLDPRLMKPCENVLPGSRHSLSPPSARACGA